MAMEILSFQKFRFVADGFFKRLFPSEALRIHTWAEDSQFIRFNGSKVRQQGSVEQWDLWLELIVGKRTVNMQVQIPGTEDGLSQWFQTILSDLRAWLPRVPEQSGLVPLVAHAPLLRGPQVLETPKASTAEIIEDVCGLFKDVPVYGLYAGGPMASGYADSKGTFHWFSTQSHHFDFTVGQGEQSVKGIWSGKEWNREALDKKKNQLSQQYIQVQKPLKVLPKGSYDVYFTPGALDDIVGMFSWNGVSQRALLKKNSAFLKVQQGQNLSPQFTLRENWGLDLDVPYDDWGQERPSVLNIIQEGRWCTGLISQKTAHEEPDLQLVSNGASSGEYLTSAEVCAGTWDAATDEQILSRLKTGIYVSQTHYLNWSHVPHGRITGMTRFGCFWVQDGQWVAPIAPMRFELNIYKAFGDCLEAITSHQEYIPATGTYDRRQLGGYLLPGILVREVLF